MPKPGVAHSQKEREAAELAHLEEKGAVARPMPRADLLVLASVLENDPDEVQEMVRKVLQHGVSPREVQALLARSYLRLGAKAREEAEAGDGKFGDGKGRDLELQYARLQARTLETLRKTVADHEDAIGIEKLIIVIQQTVVADDDDPGNIIPVE